jgi:heat shock protein HtpX
MFMTGLFLVVLYGAFATVLWETLHSYVILVVIIGGLLFCQYWFSDKIALWGMHGHLVTPEQAPELHGAIDRLCALADMPKPRVAIADTDIPNAFATGRSPKAAVVCATSGLLRRLDEPEIEAVLAHELSHVAHRDVAIMTIASSLGVIAGLLTRVMFYAGLFGGGRGGNRNGQQLVLIEMAIMLVSIVVYAISFLLTRALSRYRELAADRSGAILIGRPSLLASALVKITGEMGRIPTRDLRHAEPFNAFFFAPAISSKATQGQGTSGFSLSGLFSTHPTLERRLAQLAQLESELGQPH